MSYQVQFNKGDTFEDIKVVQVPKPVLKLDDEVLVKFILNSINGSDIEVIRGINGLAPRNYPAVPGFEGVARVESIGKNVDRVKVGQRVVVLLDIEEGQATGEGTWSSYRVYKQRVLFPVPDNVSNEAAAQAIANPVTAYGLLDKLDAPKGEYIVQSAAASAHGRIFIQFAKARGLKTINLVRREEQIADLKAIGADEVFNTEDGTDIVEEIKRITKGKGAYGVIDAVGGDLALKLSQVVRDNGTIILYGFLGGFQVNVSGPDLLLRHVNYTGFGFAKYFRDMGKAKYDEVISKVFELFANEVLPLNSKIFSLEDVSEALHQSLKPDKGEKVFLIHAQ
ncbi:NAD(P)-binding protein [Conidiobolus coronatus NRRL 28638]|uniref:NAD(P)-binding protein n=1 Tax=Conidiobolus coronatus (strain ATCC 28846 / CBS 209.66 / NRRL 28638) TaxID=796925 RepID=A0A137P1G9_CONC2|nr:NAD(P)-binding protein [Conidiobolus coronatus NRRL 28638]|eukprot:KXN68852.1 NAD(P)-binding protein [Conidiobolus coronatus NRRL 28638]